MAVYDDEKTNDDRLRDITGISKDEEKKIDERSSDSAKDSLTKSETSSATSSNSGLGSNISLSSNQLKSAETAQGSSSFATGFDNNKKTSASGGVKNFFWGSKRRKQATIGGGVVGSLVGASIFGLVFVSGPLELVHLSQILEHDFTKSQSDSQSRTNNLLRDFVSIKKGDYRYTRVSLMGAKIVSNVVQQFENAGVKFTGSDSFGRPTDIEVDRSIIESNFPETKDLTSEEFDNWLNEKFDVTSGTGFQDGNLDISGLKSQAIRSFINNTSTEILGDNAAVSAVKTRDLKNFFGLDSLFHPFSRALQNKITARAAEIKTQDPNESEGEAKTEAAADIENTNFDSNLTNLETPGVEGFDTAQGQENSFSTKIGSKLLPGAGLLWATGCTLNGVSEAIVSMNRYLTVMPAAVEATTLVSAGSQIEYGGSDITADQINAIGMSFTNSTSGQNIWSGAALQATEGSAEANALPKDSNGQTNNDLPGEYKQAFGTDTTASTLSSVGNLMLTWFPLHYVSGIVPGGQCGLIAGVGITVSGIFAQALLAVVNAPDGEVGNITLQAATKAGENVAAQSIIGKLLSPAINLVVDRIARATATPTLSLKDFSGPLGGNLIAYGARAASNMSSILNGGISLANNASTIVGYSGQQEQQQFRSENFFAKIFDIKDSRSLIGHLSMDYGTSFKADLLSGISAFTHIGSLLTSGLNNLVPSVSAAGTSDSWTGSYDWGFPQYGIPDNMLNDPALSDPYQNSEAVGQYLSSVCNDGNGNIGPSYGACGGGGGYTQRIMDCFGNNLTYSEDSDIGGNVWDSVHAATATSSDVNPVSDTYQNANCDGICPDTIADCGNTSEENWEKIVMFVNDANNIKALDCLEGNTDTSDQSCQNEGFSDDTSVSIANQVKDQIASLVGTNNTNEPLHSSTSITQQIANVFKLGWN